MAPADSLPFHVIFDVTRQVPQYWWLLIIPLIMILVGLGVFRKKPTATHRVFIVFFLGFAIFLALLQSLLIGREYAGLRSALARNDYERVEGVITNFEPEDFTKKSDERFSVMTANGPRQYQYSWSIVSQGFNGGPFYRGVLRNGMRVRIADVDGKVAKLEIER
jgi:hypothetical protein